VAVVRPPGQRTLRRRNARLRDVRVQLLVGRNKLHSRHQSITLQTITSKLQLYHISAITITIRGVQRHPQRCRMRRGNPRGREGDKNMAVGGTKFKFGQLILRKIIIIVATKCQILKRKCTKFDFRRGPAPDPSGGANSAPPDLIWI